MAAGIRGGAGEGEGLVRLVRDTADRLGHLIGQHFKLARLELMVDLREVGRRAGLMALLAPLALVGYALGMAGIAVLIGGATQVGAALVGVGLVHVVGSGVGVAIELKRL